MGGLSFALADKELVAFTTLAPAAAVAFIIMAAALLVARLGDCERRRLTTLLIVPLCIATVGFVLSATHLGTPSNALYVLARVGASGLSNEVLATTLFLGVAGSFWLSSFYRRRPPLAVRRIWLGLGIALAVAYLGATASVYVMETVPSWSTPFAPAMTVLPGVATGCLLGCACLALASTEAGGRENDGNPSSESPVGPPTAEKAVGSAGASGTIRISNGAVGPDGMGAHGSMAALNGMTAPGITTAPGGTEVSTIGRRGHLMPIALVGVALAAGIAFVIMLALQYGELVQLRNAYGPLAERIGGYVPSAIGASLLYAAAVTLAAATLLRHRGCEHTQRDRLRLARRLAGAVALAYIATLLVRIQFYAMYMTA